jgi:multiple sugar transport system permease protein
VAGACVAMAAGVGALGAGRWAAYGARRDAAFRTGQAAAAYLALMTQATPDTTDYDLRQLLVRARGLAGLPGWSDVRVFHGTAPLVHPTQRALDAAQFAELQRGEAVPPLDGAVLVALQDQAGSKTVGAVAIPVRNQAPHGWRLTAAVLLALLGLAGAVVGGGVRRAAFLLALPLLGTGVLASRDALEGAREATDRQLTVIRVAMEDIAGRNPRLRPDAAVVQLATLASGAQLEVDSDTGTFGIRRDTVNGIPRAQAPVRLSRGWLALRVLPQEATIGGWRAAAFGCGLLGLFGCLLAGGLSRVSRRPHALRALLTAWGFLGPAAVHLALFSLGPVLLLLYLAFHHWSPLTTFRPFVGLANFSGLARDPLVWRSLLLTLLYALHVPVAMAIALGLALVVKRRSIGSLVARTVLLIPYASSVVAVALVWQWIYRPEFGVLNYVARLFGLAPLDWLGNPKTALLSVMIVSIWIQVGYQVVVFLAGLRGIPREYLDAARVEGASAWQRFWRVTFPLLKPVTLFVLVTGLVTALQVFTLVFVLTRGGPSQATDVIVYHIYRMAWALRQFGGASALSLVLTAVLFAITWLQFRLLGKRIEYA